MGIIAVNSRSGAYEVAVHSSFQGLGLHLDALGATDRVVVTDDTVAPLWLAPLVDEVAPRTTVSFPAGEVHKTPRTLLSVVDQLLEAGVDRGTVVIALGGGVVGDLGGLASSLLLRGLRWVAAPTTLLAMVDASIGGKTAVNSPRGKNLIGAFHAPCLVWAARDTLTTLPAEELRSGYGEVLKTAMVGDAELLEALAEGQPPMEEVIERCARVKAHIVSGDETEAGDRVWLNAGHTVGHALEHVLGFGRLPHGEAVALGLLAEMRWAGAQGLTDPGLDVLLLRAMRRVGLRTKAPHADPAALVHAALLDKKGRGDTISVPVPLRAGVMTVVRLPHHRLAELMRFLNE